MSDEKVETRADQQAGRRDDPAPRIGPGNNDGDGDTADRAPQVSGGQPAVGDDRPRNTEF